MVESATATRRLTANFCLHQQVSTSASRTFLRRNLRQILDSHELALQHKANHASHEEMVANERSASGWDYPTHDMLKDLMRGEKPVLQLDTLHIRHPKANPRKRKRCPPTCRDEDLDWLPAPESGARWPCQVNVTVRESQASKRSVYVNTRHGTIHRSQQTTDNHSDFEIVLAQPFSIEVDKLFVAVDSGTNGSRHWKRTVTAKYSLEISFQCYDSDDSAELLSQLEHQSKSKYDDIAGNEGVVRAVWEDLPTCPRPGQLLSLKRTTGHRVISPEYGIELSMGWARKRDSPLQRHNQAYSETRDRSLQLLTPNSEDMELRTKHAITYKFCEGLSTRVKKVEGLCCPLCRERPRSFPRLLLHCSTFHDHFRFEIDEGEQDTASDASIIRKTILLSISDRQSEKFPGQRPQESINWVALDQPFDLQAHLAGDDNWPTFSRQEAPKRRGRQPAAHDKGTQPTSVPQRVLKRPAPQDVPDLPTKRHRKRVVPDVPGVRFYHSLSKKAIEPGEMVSDSDESVDEPWLVDIQRQALSALDINGASQDFVTAFNQHMMREQSGSSILMKEAVVRFTRLHLKQLQNAEWQRAYRKKLEQLERASVLSRATVAHCIHLMQAGHESEDVQMTNGVHEEGASGKTNGLTGQSNGVPHDTPNGLSKRGQIDTGSVRSPSVDPGRESTPLVNGERKGKGRVRWGTGGSISVASARPSPSIDQGTPNRIGLHGKPDEHRRNGHMDMDGDAKAAKPQTHGVHKPSQANGHSPAKSTQKTVCLCGKSAKDARAAISCDNLSCTRKDFHLACVGLQRRQPGWKCADCAG